MMMMIVMNLLQLAMLFYQGKRLIGQNVTKEEASTKASTQEASNQEANTQEDGTYIVLCQRSPMQTTRGLYSYW